MIQNGSWNAVNTGLLNSQVFALASSSSNLLAGTNGSGVWKRPLSEITGVDDANTKLPNEFSLSQNYPNPFNPSTTISYELPISGFVNLKIYDLLGREVATLVNKEQQKGNYQVSFDGSKLSSGVYYYRLQAGDFIQTKKMILIK